MGFYVVGSYSLQNENQNSLNLSLDNIAVKKIISFLNTSYRSCYSLIQVMTHFLRLGSKARSTAFTTRPFSYLLLLSDTRLQPPLPSYATVLHIPLSQSSPMPKVCMRSESDFDLAYCITSARFSTYPSVRRKILFSLTPSTLNSCARFKGVKMSVQPILGLKLLIELIASLTLKSLYSRISWSFTYKISDLVPKLMIENLQLEGRLLRKSLRAFLVTFKRFCIAMEPLLSTMKMNRNFSPSVLSVNYGS